MLLDAEHAEVVEHERAGHLPTTISERRRAAARHHQDRDADEYRAEEPAGPAEP